MGQQCYIKPIQTLQNRKTGQTPPNPTLTAHRALKAHTSPAEEVTRHTQSGWDQAAQDREYVPVLSSRLKPGCAETAIDGGLMNLLVANDK